MKIDQVLDFIPKIPISEATKKTVDFITDTFSFLFDPIQKYFGDFMGMTSKLLLAVPATIFILVMVLIAFFISGRRLGLTAFALVGLWLIYNQGLWDHFINTFTLVIMASLLSIIVGVPIGILMSTSKVAEVMITPILDFMQTMPAFVYLIPAVAFFGIGMVPGVFASFIFATPPTVRLTNLGIRQVSGELTEASEAFGSTGAQKLFKVELPMAKSTIMAGINQTVMLALSMVVIASMIGAKGLGRQVLTALQRSDVGQGFVAGIGIVILAIIIDRFTQRLQGEKEE